MPIKKAAPTPKYKLGERIMEAPKSSFSKQAESAPRKGIIAEEPFNKPDTRGATRFHYKVKWDNGRTEIYNQARLRREEV
tara:strand:+ start:2514 stop:2753 length:240 start_codon:yes stop_codon:yes gene_type:complete